MDSVSSVGVVGEWSRLDDGGAILVGVAASVMSLALAAVGGWLAHLRRGRPGTFQLFGWIVLMLNLWIVVVSAIVSPVAGTGDWMVIVDRFPNRLALQASIRVGGLFAAAAVWRITVPTLARVVGNGLAAHREERGAAIVWSVWLSSGALALVGALLAPAGLALSVAVALGGTLGSTWPILFAGRSIGEVPVPGNPLKLQGRAGLLVVATLTGLAFVTVMGRGLSLNG